MESKELAIVEEHMQLGVLSVDGPRGVISQAIEIANELAKLIRDKHLSISLQGRQYVKVEGWSTLGAMLGVLPREVSTERQEDGGYLAVVELVRVSDGAIIGRGSALCGMDEKDRYGKPTWGSRPEYARRSMAITRATGKAYRLGFSWIMTLAGYEATPAEEMDGVIIEAQVVEAHAENTQEPAPKADKSANGKQDIYQAVVDAMLAENVHAAKSALSNHCRTGYDTPEKAVAWFRLYRGWRDTGLEPKPAAEKANNGEVPK